MKIDIIHWRNGEMSKRSASNSILQGTLKNTVILSNMTITGKIVFSHI